MILLLAALAAFAPDEKPRVLDATLYHLGDDTVDRWAKQSTAKPHGKGVKVAFTLDGAPGAATLELSQLDVHNAGWVVAVNGKAVGELRQERKALTFHLGIPAGILKRGGNTLTVSNAKKWTDDILVGNFLLHGRPLPDVLGLGTLVLSVTDPANGGPVPARITIQKADGAMAKLTGARSLHTAVREGILYTLGEKVDVHVAPGAYVIHATRGTEWGLATARITVEKSGRHPVVLSLAREVATPGFVAADTHIHTLTHSGHGDASVEERMVTLAGEGVELAIATDHNHNIDYTPTQKRLGLSDHFTPVVGNEVSTDLGHINSFPLDPRDPVPNPKLKSWLALAREIRSKGARVTILNHPRWRQDRKTGDPAGPFRREKLNRATGTFGSGVRFPFDGMEVINSETVNSKKENLPLFILEEWLALLNAGETVKAIGASDSHTVGDPVGQGRTYVASATDDPAKIDVDAACRAFIEGRTTISLGIVTDIRVAGKFGLADLVPVTPGKPLAVRVRVAAPSWVTPRQALLYVNGRRVAEKPVAAAPGRPTDAWLEFEVTAPAVDAHLVAVVLGDPVKEVYWKTDWDATMAATNPVWLDADRDGAYRSPRAAAEEALKTFGDDPAKVAAALEKADPAVGVQMADLLGGRLKGQGLEPVRDALKRLAGKVEPYRALLDSGY